jgi:hypothetical protein
MDNAGSLSQTVPEAAAKQQMLYSWRDRSTLQSTQRSAAHLTLDGALQEAAKDIVDKRVAPQPRVLCRLPRLHSFSVREQLKVPARM